MTSPVRYTSAMSALFAGVKAFFEQTRQGDVVVAFGYRQRFGQLNQGEGGANRVVILPGDPRGGAGQIADTPRDVGRKDVFAADGVTRVAEVRPLVSWERIFAISVWGFDSDDGQDELLQAAATEELFEQTVQAVEQIKGAGGPNMQWGEITWTVPKLNTLGAELVVVCGLAHPLMDVPAEIGFADLNLIRVGEDADPPSTP